LRRVNKLYQVEEYYEALSLNEALELLAGSPKRQIIAGGTDLLLKMREGSIEDAQLVSIRKIEALREIKLDQENRITIGPLVTFADLAASGVILKYIPILAEAALTVGGPQIRAMATVGGNICNGVPSADSAPPLLALDAQLKLQHKGKERVVLLRDFYIGPGRVELLPGELLTQISINPGDYHAFGGCYIKFSPRKAMDLAIIGVAVTCRAKQKNKLDRVRIALGVAGPTPLRCPAAESFAQGKEVSASTLLEFGKLAVASASARDSHRASKEYREHLIAELSRRALQTAFLRAGGEINA
jgi:xanthine dehydrogenase FAD-binding subunit